MAILTPTRSKVSARVILGVVAVAAVAGAIAYFGVLPKIKTETREVAQTFDLTEENQALDIFPASEQDFYVNYRNDLKNKAGEAMPAGLALDTSAYAESQAACLENQFFSDCQIKELPNDEAACQELADRQVRFTTSNLKSIEKKLSEAKTPTEILNAQARKVKYYTTSEIGSIKTVKVYFEDFDQTILAQDTPNYQFSDIPSVYKLQAEVLAPDGQIDTELTQKIVWRYITTDPGIALTGPNGEIFPISIGETKMHAIACGKTMETKIDTQTPEENNAKIRYYNQYGKLPADLLSGSIQSNNITLSEKKDDEYISKIELSPEIISGLSATSPQFTFEILASNDSGKTWVKEKNKKNIETNTSLGEKSLVFEFPTKSSDLKLAAILRTKLLDNEYISKDLMKKNSPEITNTKVTKYINWVNHYFTSQYAKDYMKNIFFSYPEYSTFYGNKMEYLLKQNKGEGGLVMVEEERKNLFAFTKGQIENSPVTYLNGYNFFRVYSREVMKTGDDSYKNIIFDEPVSDLFLATNTAKVSVKFLNYNCGNHLSPDCYITRVAEVNRAKANNFGYTLVLGIFHQSPLTSKFAQPNLTGVLILPKTSPVFSKMQMKASLVKETTEENEEKTSPLPEQPKDQQHPVEKINTDGSKQAANWLLQTPKIIFRGEGRVIINWKSDQEKLIEAPVFLFGSSTENLDKKANVHYDQKAKKFYAILWNLEEGKNYYFKLTSENAFSDTQKFNAPTRFQNIIYLYNAILGTDFNLSKYNQPDKALRGGGPYYYWQSALSYNEIKLSLLFDTEYREFDKRLAKSAAKQGTKKQIERLFRIIYDKIYPNNLAKIANEKTVNSHLKKVRRKDSKKITLTGVKFALAKKFFKKNILKNYSKDKRPAALAYFLVLHRQDALGIDYLAQKYGKNSKAMRRELIESKEFMTKLNAMEKKYGQEAAIEEIYSAFNAKPITAAKLEGFVAEKLSVQDIQQKILQGEWK